MEKLHRSRVSLSLQFLSMEKMWETKRIELRQTSAERYSFCLPPTGGSQRHTTITFQDLPETSVKGGSEADREQLETVERGEDLEREIEAAVLELNVLLSSPHLGRLKKKVELLRSSLCQVSELFQLLLNCQDQVCTKTIPCCKFLKFHTRPPVARPAGAVPPYKALDPQVSRPPAAPAGREPHEGGDGQHPWRPPPLLSAQQEPGEEGCS